MKNILVTGASGQLGMAISAIQNNYKDFHFIFKDSQQLDITNKNAITSALEEHIYHFVINCAAYTAVDNAETDQQKAFDVNALGVKYLAAATASRGITLIHISTDYVFDGLSSVAQLENDATNPLGVYGQTKLKGEDFALELNPQVIIFRTSWLYSEFGNNFLNTMLRLFAEKSELNVVDDQVGSPTNANDLAKVILTIIGCENLTYGIFNYSNEGKCTWFDFALKIKEFVGASIRINPVSSGEFRTVATRPKLSLLDKSKIKKIYNVEVAEWTDSLKDILIKK